VSLPLLRPVDTAAPARGTSRAGIGFGYRFFLLILVGVGWIIPAFWDVRFLWGMAAWDTLVMVAWAIDLLLLPKPERIIVRRQWQGTPELGADETVSLTLENRSARALDCTVLDDVAVDLRREAPVLTVRAPAASSGTVDYQVHALQRGDRPVGNAYLRYRDGAQLGERWAMAPIAQTVRVYPNLTDAKRQTMYLGRTRQIELERRVLRQRGMGREFESLREFRDGDDVRDICWSATARRGKLVTKLHQVERSQAVWLVLDCGRLLRTKLGELCKLDYAANAAVSLAQLALYSGDRVGMLAYGRDTQARILPGRGATQAREIVEALSLLSGESSEADHLGAAARLMHLQRQRALFVWLTDLADAAMTPEVIEGAALLQSRHLVLFVVIGHPELRQVANRMPADVSQMYESAAAQELVHRRDVLLARLRERGALALEVDPGAISAALVNQYLSIKERALV